MARCRYLGQIMQFLAVRPRERVAKMSTPVSTVLLLVATLVPRVRVDASVHGRLGGGMRQQYGQEEPHTFDENAN